MVRAALADDQAGRGLAKLLPTGPTDPGADRTVAIDRDVDQPGPSPGQLSTLYVDVGAGFQEEWCSRQPLSKGGGAFALTFPLDSFPPVRGLEGTVNGT